MRLVVATALLLATAFVTLGPTDALPRRVEGLLYFIVGGIYLGSLVSTWFLRSGRFLAAVAYAQVGADVVAASGLVYLTGGAESIFTILYPLAIVNAAIGLGRRGAIAGALGSVAAFCVLAVAVERGMLPLAFVERPPMDTPRLLLTLAANLSAFVLTAMLAAHMAGALQGAQTQLDSLQVRHLSIIESIRSGIVTTDREGRITYVNPEFTALTGLGRQVLGEQLGGLLPELGQATGEGETSVQTPRGQRIFRYTISQLNDAAAPGTAILLQDETDLRRAQEDLGRADKLAALGELSAGLAHEIRNPLAAMCGSVRMLGAGKGLSEEDRRLMQMVSQEGERLEALVGDFLAFARPSPPQREALDPAELVEHTLAIFSPADSPLHISVTAEAGLRVNADPALLRQVLWNLLVNARDASGGKGDVAVRVRSQGTHAVLEVEDHGPGIPSQNLPRIFDPFYTTKQKGTGLGLAIVHRIVEAHGGQVAVESKPGNTRFSVALPLASA